MVHNHSPHLCEEILTRVIVTIIGLLVALISELSNWIRISMDAGLVKVIVRNTIPLSSLMWYDDWLKLTVSAAHIYTNDTVSLMKQNIILTTVLLVELHSANNLSFVIQFST